MDWDFFSVIPNISLETPIETDFVAIVPAEDERASLLMEKHRNLRHLVNNFSDQFGRKFSAGSSRTVRNMPPELSDTTGRRDAAIGAALSRRTPLQYPLQNRKGT